MHTSNTSNGFTTGKIGDMDKGVVEGGENVGNAENEFTFTDLGTKGNVFRGLLGSSTLGLNRCIMLK